MDEPSPEVVAEAVTEALVAVLGDLVLGVVGHGSWVHGDFCPGRSDLDLVVVLRRDPDDAFLAVAGPVLAGLAERFPAWRERFELGFTSREAVEAVLAGDESGHLVGRISPGEPLQLVIADRHRLLDWDAAHAGRSLYGPPATDLLPAVPAPLVREIVLQHLQHWPTWLTESTAPGFRAYAVLTVSRAAACLASGQRVSKRAGAAWAETRFPDHRPLLQWAVRWWYQGGRDDETPPDGVDRFVDAMLNAATSA